jgi:hypothetical protein
MAEKSNVLRFPMPNEEFDSVPPSAQQARAPAAQGAPKVVAGSVAVLLRLMRRVALTFLFCLRFASYFVLRWLRVPLAWVLCILPGLSALTAVVLFFYHPKTSWQRWELWLICGIVGSGSIALLHGFDRLLNAVRP